MPMVYITPPPPIVFVDSFTGVKSEDSPFEYRDFLRRVMGNPIWSSESKNMLAQHVVIEQILLMRSQGFMALPTEDHVVLAEAVRRPYYVVQGPGGYPLTIAGFRGINHEIVHQLKSFVDATLKPSEKAPSIQAA